MKKLIIFTVFGELLFLCALLTSNQYTIFADIQCNCFLSTGFLCTVQFGIKFTFGPQSFLYCNCKEKFVSEGGEFSLFLSGGSLFLGIFGKSAKFTKTRSRSISCHIVTLLCYFVVGIISILGENFLILTKRKKKKAKSKYTHDYFF